MNYKKLLFVLISLPLISSAQNIKSNENAFIDRLLSKMTLEEKIGQLNQISPYGDISGMLEKGQVGSVLNVIGAKAVNKMQRVAVEKSRLGIPLLFSRDVIHGYHTMLPIPLGQAATFDTEAVRKGAEVAAMEASAEGIRWTFAPMIDIARDPRWGRIAEGCGEDPYLASLIGAAMVKGFQGNDLSSRKSIAACAKHFVGYGASEGGRDYNSTNIPERLLRNVYLPPFKACADVGTASFMVSFNDNDGIPSSGNKFILDNVLRKEWNFKGFVVSDWNSIAETVTHGFSKDMSNAAFKSINAGVDMDMESRAYTNCLKKLVENGELKEDIITDAARRILRIKYRLGLFDNPYVEENEDVSYSANNLNVARNIAEESAILLKNNGVLPIKGKHTVAIIGPMADAPYEQMGTWSFDGDKNHTVTPLTAFRKLKKEGINVLYAQGLRYSRDKDSSLIDEAKKIACKADIIIVFVGEEAILSGEAHSLANLHLQGLQTTLIDELHKLGKPVVTVVMAGRPLIIGKELEQSSAMIYMFHPGTMGGPAIANIITGKVNPSGKTPITFPRMEGQIPIYYAHNNTGRPATKKETLLDNIEVGAGQTSLGCTSFWLDAGFSPLIPFGYGLSYSSFEYSNLKLSSKQVNPKDTLIVSFDLKNNGSYDGTEVAQLYIRDDVASVTRPVKELKGFKRVFLKASETKSVSFELPVSNLAFWNIDMKYLVEPGSFTLWIGTNSEECQLSDKFEVQ